mmetsp:Transcript_19738/g.42886  ORF Transcript_19738/g.42886 Transcript_19738/m.42886 type:complete len:303 (-) Transcript_19738:377-1285(-)
MLRAARGGPEVTRVAGIQTPPGPISWLGPGAEPGPRRGEGPAPSSRGSALVGVDPAPASPFSCLSLSAPSPPSDPGPFMSSSSALAASSTSGSAGPPPGDSRGWPAAPAVLAEGGVEGIGPVDGACVLLGPGPDAGAGPLGAVCADGAACAEGGSLKCCVSESFDESRTVSSRGVGILGSSMGGAGIAMGGGMPRGSCMRGSKAAMPPMPAPRAATPAGPIAPTPSSIGSMAMALGPMGCWGIMGPGGLGALSSFPSPFLSFRSDTLKPCCSNQRPKLRLGSRSPKSTLMLLRHFFEADMPA